MEKEPTYELVCHGDGCCVRDCILAEDYLYVWLCSGVWGAGGSECLRSLTHWDWRVGMENGRTGLALQVFGLPFLEHSNESLYPRGLADPDVMRWGWGLSPASGLAASDKKPWEEFTTPFNTVIIFSAFSGWGLLLPGMPVSLPSGRCQGCQVHRITS